VGFPTPSKVPHSPLKRSNTMSVDFHSPATSAVLTADGAVGTSGRDTIVWGLVVGAGADAATA
jgi:hypothetical protein